MVGRSVGILTSRVGQLHLPLRSTQSSLIPTANSMLTTLSAPSMATTSFRFTTTWLPATSERSLLSRDWCWRQRAQVLSTLRPAPPSQWSWNAKKTKRFRCRASWLRPARTKKPPSSRRDRSQDIRVSAGLHAKFCKYSSKHLICCNSVSQNRSKSNWR